MNKEILITEIGEARDHLASLLEKIQKDELQNPYDLELILRDVIRHAARAYNYRNSKNEDYLSPGTLEKMARPPKELLY